MTQRYYHIRVHEDAHREFPVRDKGGATVRIIQAENDPGRVGISVAWCSPKDVFNKRIGRETSMAMDCKIIPIRQLPSELAHVWKTVHKRAKETAYPHAVRPNFDARMREWLPKE